MRIDIWNIYIPAFEGYTRVPHDTNCIWINTRNIIAEILWWEHLASIEIQDSFKWKDILIEWEYAIVLRYKREKDNQTYPAIVMWFDITDDSEIIIRHIQGTKQKKIAYRFASSFDYVSYLITLIRENFTDRWVHVSLPSVPTNLEWASYWWGSFQMYHDLRRKLEILNASIKQ